MNKRDAKKKKKNQEVRYLYPPIGIRLLITVILFRCHLTVAEHFVQNISNLYEDTHPIYIIQIQDKTSWMEGV